VALSVLDVPPAQLFSSIALDNPGTDVSICRDENLTKIPRISRPPNP
jgi:hypothetical protein